MMRCLAGGLFPLLLAVSFEGLAQTPAPSQPGRSSLLSAERAFWESIDQASAVELKLYLDKFPNGLYAGLAKRRLQDAEEAAVRAKAQAEEAARRAKAQAEEDERRRLAQIEAERKKAADEATALAAAKVRPGRDRPFGVFDYQVGNEWSYVVRDGRTLIPERNYTFRVVAATDELITMSDGKQLTWNGAVIQDNNGRYEPERAYIQFPLFVGKRWRARYAMVLPNGSRVDCDIAFRVITNEVVHSPAGPLDSTRIEGVGSYSGADNGRVEVMLWYSAKIGQSSKWVYSFTPGNSLRPTTFEIHELTATNTLSP